MIKYIFWYTGIYIIISFDFICKFKKNVKEKIIQWNYNCSVHTMYVNGPRSVAQCSKVKQLEKKLLTML